MGSGPVEPAEEGRDPVERVVQDRLERVAELRILDQRARRQGGHGRAQQVVPCERVRGARQKQGRDLDPRPVCRAHRGGLGCAGTVDRVAEADQGSVAPGAASNRQRGDPPAVRVAADHDPRLVGDLGLERGNRILGTPAREVDGMGVEPARPQAVDPGRHRRRVAGCAVAEVDPPHRATVPERSGRGRCGTTRVTARAGGTGQLQHTGRGRSSPRSRRRTAAVVARSRRTGSPASPRCCAPPRQAARPVARGRR